VFIHQRYYPAMIDGRRCDERRKNQAEAIFISFFQTQKTDKNWSRSLS
jgi:hypothetical protein